MNIEQLAIDWLPPKIAWRLTRRARERRELGEFSNFYRNFLNPGDLCIDVGANIGNRTRCFRHLGCKVVAVEPQENCFKQLEHEFGRDPEVTLEKAALGRIASTAKIKVSSHHVLSTLSDTFINRTLGSGRFAGIRWDKLQSVEITTLDCLIARHGKPKFIKVDVEGYESEVLAGLSTPVTALSIEWVPEFPENAISCVRHLMKLGDYEFNLSWGEKMTFSRKQWRSADSILRVISEFEEEAYLFGDIYARIR